MSAPRLALVLLTAGLVGTFGCGPGGEPAARRPPDFITAITRNLYVGTDIETIVFAPTLEAASRRAEAAWAEIQAADFGERAAALAAEIAAHRPHVAGLQEVSTFLRQSPGDFLSAEPRPATDVILDFLPTLLAELEERGSSYEPAAVARHFDIELPMAIGDTAVDDMRIIDADVVLVRSDLVYRNPVSMSFSHGARVSVGGSESPVRVTIHRGWASVDVTVGGTEWRVVSTHLEPAETDPAIQSAQARQLLEWLADAGRPVLVTGDLNSAADGSTTSTYRTFLDAGFRDLWSMVAPDAPGYTCCHRTDLRNPESELDMRIDYILYRDVPSPESPGMTATASWVDLLGADPADRTPSGLWPSDHAGVVVRLQLP